MLVRFVVMTSTFACSANDATTAPPPNESAAAPDESSPGSTTPGDSPSTDAPSAPTSPQPNAPPLDAGTDAGPNKAAWFGNARCANSGLLFCDSFEGNAIDDAKWDVEKNGANTIAIDTSQKARGSKSLKIHMVGSTSFQYAWLSTTKVFPALQGHLFGRMFYRVEKLPTKNMHWTTIEVLGPLAGKNVLLRYGGEYDNFMANYVTGSGEMGKFSKTPVPIGTWTCLEWEYDASTDAMRLWADETLIGDVEVVNDPKWSHPVYQKIYVGWQNYQPKLVVPMNVWIDDVALDKNRIGCTK